MSPIFWFLNFDLFFINAASTTALEGSTTSFNLFSIIFSQAKISSSETNNISFPDFWMIGKLIVPRFVLNPSAIVLVDALVSIFPDINDRYASSTFDGSAPITLQFLEKLPIAIEVPAINPPPPIGEKI